MKKYLISLLYLCCVISVCSQNIEDNIRKANAVHHYTKCKFTQEKHLVVIDKTELLDGILYLKENDKLSMHYSSSTNFLSINSDLFYMKTGKKIIKARLNNNEMFRQLSSLLINSMYGRLDEIQSITNSDKTITSDDKYYIVTFTKEKKQVKGYKTIVLKYSKSKKQLVEMKLEEYSGNYNLYKLSNYEYPSSLSDDLFRIE